MSLSATMRAMIPSLLLVFSASIALCGAQLHYSKSPINECSNQECAYEYFFVMGQFRQSEDQPLTVNASVQIMCESTGSYGSINATRYCLSVTDIGGNFLSFQDNNTTEGQQVEKDYALERLSGWFCFGQTSDGHVVSVFHSQTEETEVVNIKKGIAAAFQANFRGTAEEVEIDTQSRHISHYSYLTDSRGEKMHRTINSADVIEYPMHIPPRDVQFNEEDDIEYRDGRLVKSNGTMHLSIDRTKSFSDSEENDEFSDVFTAHGSFSMELKLCYRVAPSSRRRRAIQQSIDSKSSVEEGLMAIVDERKIELDKLETLRHNLKTPHQVIAALQNINSGKNFRTLQQVMVLERKYGAQGVSVIHVVLHYLNKVKKQMSEEYVSQRVSIYSVLSAEGSTRAENALIERLQAEDTSESEKRSIVLAVASLPTPSPRLILILEGMISQDDSETSILLLAYGALVANAAPDQDQKMVSFLTDRLPDNSAGNTGTLIHILHALGNTKSSLAVEHIVQYTGHEDEEVRLTAVMALRFFTNRPDIQQLLLDISRHSSEAVVEVIIGTLRDGYEYNREIQLNQELIEVLANITISLRSHYLQDELVNFLRDVGTPSALRLVDVINSNRAEEVRRLKRASTNKWDSASPDYDILCPLSERRADVEAFPSHIGYLWSKTVGKNSGDHKFYLKVVAGLFSGGNICNCDFKILGKAVVRGHLLGKEADALRILGFIEKHNGTIKGKLYAKLAGSVLLDVDLTRGYCYRLPQYKLTIFSVSYTFNVYIVPITLDASVSVMTGGALKAEVGVSGDGTIWGNVSLTPSITATLDASASVSLLVVKVGIFLTGTITYSVGMEVSVGLCRPSDPLFLEMCISAHHCWSPITIKVGAFYQLRTWRLSWGRRRTWSPLTYTWTLPGSGCLLLCEVCSDNGDDSVEGPTNTTCLPTPTVSPTAVVAIRKTAEDPVAAFLDAALATNEPTRPLQTPYPR